jgi:two-component system phosphate regulon response regulator PhoB
MTQKPIRCVLVVDDLNEGRALMRFPLERDGWRVLEASDGSQAVVIALKEQPHIILMDYNMPFVNGIEACRQIKGNTSTAHIPVIIYTGLNLGDIRRQALEAGAYDFLVKPILTDELLALIRVAYQQGR